MFFPLLIDSKPTSMSWTNEKQAVMLLIVDAYFAESCRRFYHKTLLHIRVTRKNDEEIRAWIIHWPARHREINIIGHDRATRGHRTPQEINNLRLSSRPVKIRAINHGDETRFFARVEENRVESRIFVLIYERPNFTAARLYLWRYVIYHLGGKKK